MILTQTTGNPFSVRCRICKKPIGNAPHWNGVHASCWEREREPFPYIKELHAIERRVKQLEELSAEVEELVDWLQQRRRLWPRGAHETITRGSDWVHRVRLKLKKKPPQGKH